jgi:predicted RNA-binding Zn-ribbon protein involved in translation (DUF1610 family)
MIFDENECKRILELLYEKQLTAPTVCPRCGKATAGIDNAMSRRAKVMICDDCGKDEAMMDFAKFPPIPFSEWEYFENDKRGDN